MNKTILSWILRLIGVLLVLAAAPAAVAQTSRYARDGMSFTYPSEWPLSDESDATAQSLHLDPGPNEAKIMIVALRRQLNPQQLSEVQPKMTEAITSGVIQEIAHLGAQAQRSSITETIGGVSGQGVRLRATLKGETSDVDVYWLYSGSRLLHIVFVGSEPERVRAAHGWKMICATLRVGTSTVSPPPAR